MPFKKQSIHVEEGECCHPFELNSDQQLPLLKKEKKIESDTGQILNHRRTTNMGPNFGILEARLIGSCLGTLHVFIGPWPGIIRF